ncbi:MAG: hypothetical protein ACE5NA_12820 [Nitrospiraceae bacterium]
MSIEIDRRTHDALRNMVEEACTGILPCIAERVREVARKAYYLGCADGIAFAKQNEQELVEGMRHNHET